MYNKKRGDSMKKFLGEFKEFISKGNVVDLAVAVIIGASFSAIVSSLVGDIIMPLFGTIVGQNFSNLSFEINGSSIAYGKFLQAIFDFLIIAFFIFLFTKGINKIRKKKEKEAPKKSEEVKLLEEIRDLLKENK